MRLWSAEQIVPFQQKRSRCQTQTKQRQAINITDEVWNDTKDDAAYHHRNIRTLATVHEVVGANNSGHDINDNHRRTHTAKQRPERSPVGFPVPI